MAVTFTLLSKQAVVFYLVCSNLVLLVVLIQALGAEDERCCPCRGGSDGRGGAPAEAFQPARPVDVPVWDAVTPNYVYFAADERPRRTMGGADRIETQDVVNRAMALLQGDGRFRGSELVSLEHIQRHTDRQRGTDYVLYMKIVFETGSIGTVRVELVRPFTALQLVHVDQLDLSVEVVNIVIPLAGRLPTLKKFLMRLRELQSTEPKSVFRVFVGYMGDDASMEEASKILHDFSEETKILAFISKVAQEMNAFSRATAIETAVSNVKTMFGERALLFFADVDVVVLRGFMMRCQTNTKRNSRVYAPILFSLYNGKEPDVDKERGIWRTFGYGMLCIFVSDYDMVGGFLKTSKKLPVGWGSEDVDLMTRLLLANLNVTRAVDPALFHAWHPQECSRDKMSRDQYFQCHNSALQLRGSHKFLAKTVEKFEQKKT